MYYILCITALFFSACGPAREYLGIDREVPNEYESLSHEGIEVPNSGMLQDPKLGVRRPQHLLPMDKTRTIMGIKSGTSGAISKSEDFLLRSAGHDKSLKNIRETVDVESLKEPTIREKIQDSILFWKKRSKGKVIDPRAEKESLKPEQISTEDQ